MATKHVGYKVIALHDPALVRPELPDPPELDLVGPDGKCVAPDDPELPHRRFQHELALAEHEKVVDALVEEWRRKLRVARERQDWTGLIIDGKTPRYVVMRWVPDEVLAWWQDQRRDDATGGAGELGLERHLRLLVRIAISSIEGDRPRTFALTRNERIDWEVADRDALDEIKAIVGGAAYPRFVADLGRQIYEQEARGRPL